MIHENERDGGNAWLTSDIMLSCSDQLGFKSDPLAGGTPSAIDRRQGKGRRSKERALPSLAAAINIRGSHWISILRGRGQQPICENPQYHLIDTQCISETQFTDMLLTTSAIPTMSYYTRCDKFRILPLLVPKQRDDFACGYLCLFWLNVLSEYPDFDVTGYRYIYSQGVLKSWIMYRFTPDSPSKYDDILRVHGVTVTSGMTIANWIPLILQKDAGMRKRPQTLDGYYQVFRRDDGAFQFEFIRNTVH